MTFLFVLFCVMLSLMLFPLLLGRYSRDNDRQEPLLIKSDNVKDPRYFSKSFREKLESAIAGNQAEEVLHLSKDEKVLWADGIEFTPDHDINELVLAIEETLRIPARCRFQKEIYSAKDAYIGSRTTVRALAGLGNVELGEGVHVLRWVDAENTLSIGPNCILGISATAGTRINMEPNCTFRRLFAPEIRVGRSPVENWDTAAGAQEKTEESSNQISRQQRVPPKEKIAGSVISSGNLILESDCEVLQSVRAEKNLHICSGAIVRKNVFADGDIIIEDEVIIGGDVFAQGSVFIGSHCRIGTAGQIKSLVARESITVSQGSVIYGYVGSETIGKVVENEAYFELLSGRY